MTRKEFKLIIKELQILDKGRDKLNEALKIFDPDFNFISFSRYDCLVLKCLSIIMNDKSDWIGYWIYDRDWGKESKLDDVTMHGKKIPLKTVNDLYNILTK